VTIARRINGIKTKLSPNPIFNLINRHSIQILIATRSEWCGGSCCSWPLVSPSRTALAASIPSMSRLELFHSFIYHCFLSTPPSWQPLRSQQPTSPLASPGSCHNVSDDGDVWCKRWTSLIHGQGKTHVGRVDVCGSKRPQISKITDSFHIEMKPSVLSYFHVRFEWWVDMTGTAFYQLACHCLTPTFRSPTASSGPVLFSTRRTADGDRAEGPVGLYLLADHGWLERR
jgi:hypothetical protein